MIDISKIRPGDEVTVRAKVLSTDDNDICIKIPNALIASFYVEPEDLATHTPAPREIKVGDLGTFQNNKLVYEVVHIRDELAWLSNRNNDTFAHLSNITHAENDDGR